ncbi:hypothetical protein [Microbacterium deminutum]
MRAFNDAAGKDAEEVLLDDVGLLIFDAFEPVRDVEPVADFLCPRLDEVKLRRVREPAGDQRRCLFGSRALAGAGRDERLKRDTRGETRRDRRCVLSGNLSLATSVVLAVAAMGSSVPTKELRHDLTAVWTTVFETPSAENPFGSGGPAFACIELRGAVAPFAPDGVESCTVKPGTKIFVMASSFECSTFEANGTTESELRACARAGDPAVAPTVTVDGKRVRVVDSETPLLNVVLPDDNIFGLPGGSEGLSVAHGWVALLHPFTPGRHTILIGDSISTTIIVRHR